jgi:hypothetical protein
VLSGQDVVAADVAQVDVIVKFLQRHADAHRDGNFFDRGILVFEGLHCFVAQGWMRLVLQE